MMLPVLSSRSYAKTLLSFEYMADGLKYDTGDVCNGIQMTQTTAHVASFESPPV